MKLTHSTFAFQRRRVWCAVADRWHSFHPNTRTSFLLHVHAQIPRLHCASISICTADSEVKEVMYILAEYSILTLSRLSTQLLLKSGHGWWHCPPKWRLLYPKYWFLHGLLDHICLHLPLPQALAAFLLAKYSKWLHKGFLKRIQVQHKCRDLHAMFRCADPGFGTVGQEYWRHYRDRSWWQKSYI